MDALYPRLLVEDFATAAGFWTEALRDLLGIEPVKVLPEAGYANWDLNGEAVLVLFSRAAIAAGGGGAGGGGAVAAVAGNEALPATAGGQDAAMLVLRVDSVDDATPRFAAHGAKIVADPQDRPEWGPNLRTAHLRTPDGTLVELQSY